MRTEGLSAGVATRLGSSVGAPEMTRRPPSMSVLRRPPGSFGERALRPTAGISLGSAPMGLAIPACGVDLPASPCGLTASSGTALPLLLLERVDSPLEASQDLLEE